MAKDRQIVVRLDNDLAEIMEKTAADLHRSRAVVLCTALHLLANLTPRQREEAVGRYLAREETGRKGTK